MMSNAKARHLEYRLKDWNVEMAAALRELAEASELYVDLVEGCLAGEAVARDGPESHASRLGRYRAAAGELDRLLETKVVTPRMS